MASGESPGFLEDPHDLGGLDQDLSGSLVKAIGVGAEDLHVVAGAQTLQHVP
jgi:hypothetical protein